MSAQPRPPRPAPTLSIWRVTIAASVALLPLLGWAVWSVVTPAPTLPVAPPEFDSEPDVAPQQALAAVAPVVAPQVLSKNSLKADVPMTGKTSRPESSPRLVAPPGSTGPDWPAPQGPNHDGCSPETGLNLTWAVAGPAIAWEQPIGKGYNIPAIVNDRVLTWSRYDAVERVESRKLETGDLVWSREFPASYVSPFQYSDGPHASPVVSEGLLYLLGAAGEFRALRVDDGAVVWERFLKRDLQLPDTAYSLGATPLLTDGIAILQLPARKARAGLLALDAVTGETLWQATENGLSFASPKRVPESDPPTFIAFTTFGLQHVLLHSGQELGRFKFGVGESRERVNAVSPLIVGDRVFAIAGPGPGTLALRREPSGELSLLWRNRRLLDSQYTSVVYRDGYLYGFNSLWNGSCELRCIDVERAEQVWAVETDLRRGQLIWADGRLIALGEHGHLGVIAASPSLDRAVQVTSDPFLSGPCYSAPALANGRLVLRNEAKLVVIDCRPR
jgi:outer membrane protein assembly factor BamB